MRLVLFCLTAGITSLTLILSIVSAYSSTWVTQTLEYNTPPLPGLNKALISYGLFERCESSMVDSTSWVCRKFPMPETDCRINEDNSQVMVSKNMIAEFAPNSKTLVTTNTKVNTPSYYQPKVYRYTSLCSLWRLAGYFSQLSIAFGGAAVCSLLVVLGGGRRRRQSSWPLCASLVGLHALFQVATFALVVHAYRTEARFQTGASLGSTAWVSLVAWIGGVVIALASVLTGALGQWELPDKRGYKPILG